MPGFREQPVTLVLTTRASPASLNGGGFPVRRIRIAVSFDEKTVDRLDRAVRGGRYSSRSQAIRGALEQELRRTDRRRFARECAKLDPAVESALAEEGLSEDLTRWPRY